MTKLTASEKNFLAKFGERVPVMRIDQTFVGTIGGICKRPDFLISVRGLSVFVEVKPPGAEITGEEYHRILNTSLAFGIPAVIVWAGRDECEFSCVLRPVPNDGIVDIQRNRLTEPEDIFFAIQRNGKDGNSNK